MTEATARKLARSLEAAAKAFAKAAPPPKKRIPWPRGDGALAYFMGGYGAGGKTWKEPPENLIQRRESERVDDGYQQFATARQMSDVLAQSDDSGLNWMGHTTGQRPGFDFFGDKIR